MILKAPWFLSSKAACKADTYCIRKNSISAGSRTSQFTVYSELPELVCKLWKSCMHHRQMEYKGIQKNNKHECGRKCGSVKGRSLLNCWRKTADTHTRTLNRTHGDSFFYFWVLLSLLFFFPLSWQQGKGVAEAKALFWKRQRRCRKISDSMKWDFKWLQTF